MANVHDVAAAVLTATGPESPMKLQKLLYYTQAWHLAMYDRPLFTERIEAWQDGPVVPQVWKHHKGQSEVECWAGGDPARLTADEHAVVSFVVDRYAGFTRSELSTMTHDEEPWREARAGLADGEPSGAPLSREVMTRFFRRQIADPETAVAEAVANARLEGQEVSPEGLAAMRAVANGEITVEEAIARRIAVLRAS